MKQHHGNTMTKVQTVENLQDNLVYSIKWEQRSLQIKRDLKIYQTKAIHGPYLDPYLKNSTV